MVIVMNRIPVLPKYAEAFEDRFKDRAALVDRMPGFLFSAASPYEGRRPFCRRNSMGK